MDTRTLGGTLTVPAIGFGTLPLTGGYGPIDPKAALAVIRTALDAGIGLIDTADFYGGGDIETLVGRAIAGRRDDAVIATRGGAVIEGSARPTRFDGTAAFLHAACNASLRRLGTDHIDLYYLARPDPRIPIEESIGALAALVTTGKVGHLGLSEVSADMLRRAQAVHPITALQSEHSLWEPNPVAADAHAMGIGFLAHSPLGRGFLTGGIGTADQLAPGDFRRRQPRFADDTVRRDRRLLESGRPIAEAHHATLGQIALAWLLAQPGTVPIPGTRDAAHLAQNTAAADITLSTLDLETLSRIFAPVSAGDPR